MRLGIVKGTVVLSRGLAALEGTRYLIVEPVTSENLKAGRTRRAAAGRSSPPITWAPAWDRWSASKRAAKPAVPWLPAGVPVDAYVSGIVDSIFYQAAE